MLYYVYCTNNIDKYVYHKYNYFVDEKTIPTKDRAKINIFKAKQIIAKEKKKDKMHETDYNYYIKLIEEI